MGQFAFRIFIFLLLNMLISTVVSLLIPNTYLAAMVTSVVLAFIFTAMSTPKGKGKFTSQTFWMQYFTLAIAFLLMDALFFII